MFYNERCINERSLTNPVKVIDGIIFVPLSILSDAYGYETDVDSTGVALVTKPGATAISDATIASVCELFE